MHVVIAGLARDLPADAHGPLLEPIVTAPTPGHLFCMKLLEKAGRLKQAERPEEVSLPYGANCIKSRLAQDCTTLHRLCLSCS